MDLSFRERVVAFLLPCVFQQPIVDMSQKVYPSRQDSFYWAAPVHIDDPQEAAFYKIKNQTCKHET